MNTNKNSYTLIYMVVMIIIVSLLLSITSGVLKSRQQENVKLDKKKQILSSLPAVDFSADPAAAFAATITEYNMLDAGGNVAKRLDPVDDFDYVPAEGEYPVYVANVDGAKKYIIRMDGKGLWGAIWGYIALNDDLNTVYGVFFSHAGETPGLGAEIVKDVFRTPFQGKHILNAEGAFVSIAIEKHGIINEEKEQVDAISGGTITSKGVESMILESLRPYEPFFATGADASEAGAADAGATSKENADEAIVEPANEEGETK